MKKITDLITKKLISLNKEITSSPWDDHKLEAWHRLYEARSSMMKEDK